MSSRLEANSLNPKLFRTNENLQKITIYSRSGQKLTKHGCLVISYPTIFFKINYTHFTWLMTLTTTLIYAASCFFTYFVSTQCADNSYSLPKVPLSYPNYMLPIVITPALVYCSLSNQNFFKSQWPNGIYTS